MIDNPKLLFIFLAGLLTITDFRNYRVPNMIVIPGIILGIFLTGYWQWALCMGALGAAFFGYEWMCPRCGHVENFQHKYSLWRGGDVKLLAMVGAFLGWLALPIFIVSYGILLLFRVIMHVFYKPLPYTPFVFFVSLGFIWL